MSLTSRRKPPAPLGRTCLVVKIGLTTLAGALVQADAAEARRTGAGAGMGRPAPGKVAAARRAAAAAGASAVGDLVRSLSQPKASVWLCSPFWYCMYMSGGF